MGLFDLLVLGVPPPDFSGFPGPVGERAIWQVIMQRVILIMFGLKLWSPFWLWVLAKPKQCEPGD